MSRDDVEFMEEFRQDMMREAYEEQQEEISMRNDDDYFSDSIVDNFSDEVNTLREAVDKYCSSYDRDAQADDWFQHLLENC